MSGAWITPQRNSAGPQNGFSHRNHDDGKPAAEALTRNRARLRAPEHRASYAIRSEIEDHLDVERGEALALVEASGTLVRVREADGDRAGPALECPAPARVHQCRTDAGPALLGKDRQRLHLRNPVAEIPRRGARAGGEHRVADRAAVALGDEQHRLVAAEPALVLTPALAPGVFERTHPGDALGDVSMVLVERAPERLEVGYPLRPAIDDAQVAHAPEEITDSELQPPRLADQE